MLVPNNSNGNLEEDGDDVQTIVPTLRDNPHWGNTPAFKWLVPEEFPHSFTLREQQEAVRNNLQDKPWPTKTGHTHLSDGRCSNVTMEVCIGRRNPHIRVDPPEEISYHQRNTYGYLCKLWVRALQPYSEFVRGKKHRRAVGIHRWPERERQPVPAPRRSDLVDSENDDVYHFEVESEMYFEGPVYIRAIPILLRLERVLMRPTPTHRPTVVTDKRRHVFMCVTDQKKKTIVCGIHVVLSTMKLVFFLDSSKDVLHLRCISLFQPTRCILAFQSNLESW